MKALLSILLLLVSLLHSPRAEAFDFSNAKPEEVAKVETALTFLNSTYTGASILKDLNSTSFSIEIDRNGDSNGSYDDEYKVLSINAKALAWPDWKLARLLCHELTHAVQDSMLINRANYDNGDPAINASGVVEFAALSMEVRFWVEAGMPADSVRDFNTLRREAYLYFPETVRIGWTYTNRIQKFKEPVMAWADARLAVYWEAVLNEESAWRALNSTKFPKKDIAVALEYLKERYKKPVSPWLPNYLEALGLLPASPTDNDLELIRLHRYKN